MRLFENKETEIPNGEKNLTYSGLIKACTDRIPKEGLVTSEQKKRLDVQCLIHDDLKVGAQVKIEEHIYETIKSCVINFPWSAMHKDLVTFEEDMKGLEEIKKK